MSVDKAVNIMIKAIYLERTNILVGKFVYGIVATLCFLSDWINNLAGDIKYKS